MLTELVITALWTAARPARAQEAPELRWSPVLELRDRVDVAGGADPGGVAGGGQPPAPEDGSRASLGLRSVVGLEVERLALSARVSLADQRAWTTDPDGVVEPDIAGIGVAEAWTRVRWSLNRNVGVTATVGRQTLELHEGRILGDDDLALAPQLLDAARVELDARPFSFELANARRFVEDDARGLGVLAARAGLSREEGVTRWVADALWVVDGRRAQTTSSTLGAYAKLESGRWLARGELYLQSRDDGAATLFGARAGHLFGMNERVLLALAYDGASGDGGGPQGGTAAWRPVLGDQQRFRGLVDPFASSETLPAAGLGDGSVSVEVQPSARLRASLAAHAFVPTTAAGAYGWSVDGGLDWAFSPFASARGRFGAFTPLDAAYAQQRLGRVELHVDF